MPEPDIEPEKVRLESLTYLTRSTMHAILPLMLLSALAAGPQFHVQLLDSESVSTGVVTWKGAQLSWPPGPHGRRRGDGRHTSGPSRA